MSSSRVYALAFVAFLHVAVGAGLVLFRPDIVKKIIAPIQAVEVKEEAPPPDEPPPPPPKEQDIPPFVPPPEVSIASEPAPSPITVQSVAPQPAPTFTPPAPPQPAPPPAPPAGPTRGAVPKGNQSVITTDDYPDASQRAQEAGTTVVSYTVSTAGRASNCNVTTSSGFPRLDARTCELITRRFRFDPALNNGQPVEATKTQKVTWKLPSDR